MSAKLKKHYFSDRMDRVSLIIKFREPNKLFKTILKKNLENWLWTIHDEDIYKDYDDFFEQSYEWFKDDVLVKETIKRCVEKHFINQKENLSQLEKEKEMKTKTFNITIK